MEVVVGGACVHRDQVGSVDVAADQGVVAVSLERDLRQPLRRDPEEVRLLRRLAARGGLEALPETVVRERRRGRSGRRRDQPVGEVVVERRRPRRLLVAVQVVGVVRRAGLGELVGVVVGVVLRPRRPGLRQAIPDRVVRPADVRVVPVGAARLVADAEEAVEVVVRVRRRLRGRPGSRDGERVPDEVERRREAGEGGRPLLVRDGGEATVAVVGPRLDVAVRRRQRRRRLVAGDVVAVRRGEAAARDGRQPLVVVVRRGHDGRVRIRHLRPVTGGVVLVREGRRPARYPGELVQRVVGVGLRPGAVGHLRSVVRTVVGEAHGRRRV